MYANCDHEVTEVTEGCRITLTFKVYNELDNILILNNVGKSRKSRIDSFIKTLKESGLLYLEENTDPYNGRENGFIIPLSNVYPEIKNIKHNNDYWVSGLRMYFRDDEMLNFAEKCPLPYVVLDNSNIKNIKIGKNQEHRCEYWFYFILIDFD